MKNYIRVIENDRLENNNQLLYIIEGQSGSGKTFYALEISKNLSIIQRMPVALFFLENEKWNIMDRFIKLHNVLPSDIGSAPLFINYKNCINFSELKEDVQCMIINKNLKLVIIDYLQKFGDFPVGDESRSNKIISSLQKFSSELDLPIIAMSQLLSSSTKDNIDNNVKVFTLSRNNELSYLNSLLFFNLQLGAAG